MHERFLVHLQLCFVVSFVLRVLGLQEGISSGKALGWTTGTLIWMPGKRTLLLIRWSLRQFPFCLSVDCGSPILENDLVVVQCGVWGLVSLGLPSVYLTQ